MDKLHRWYWPLLALGLWACAARGQFGPELIVPVEMTPAQKLAVELALRAYERNVEAYRDNPDMLVRPGVLADRRQRQVRLWGRATRLSPSDPVEFFIVPEGSGKEYEAVTKALAKASDVKAALEFIGLVPGRPVDFERNLFWPRGERVAAWLEWDEPPEGDGPPQPRRVRMEELVAGRDGQPLPLTGFVFTGSYTFRPEGSSSDVLAADVHDSQSIISDYNERCSLLDVPRQAPQSAVYGTQKPSGKYRLGHDQPVQMVLEPLHPDGPRVRDYTLEVYVPPEGLGAATLTLADADGPVETAPGLVGFLAALEKITRAGVDAFVTVKLDGRMTLAAARQAARFLAEIDTEAGIRIEGPPPGELYYRNLLPPERWRERSGRLGRPWELRLARQNGVLSGALILPADEIDDNQGRGDLLFPVHNAADIARTLAEKSDKWAHSVYIFAPPEATLGELMTLIRPGMEVRPAMYLYLPPEP